MCFVLGVEREPVTMLYVDTPPYPPHLPPCYMASSCAKMARVSGQRNSYITYTVNYLIIANNVQKVAENFVIQRFQFQISNSYRNSMLLSDAVSFASEQSEQALVQIY